MEIDLQLKNEKKQLDFETKFTAKNLKKYLIDKTE
jgi:hypothetical protein